MTVDDSTPIRQVLRETLTGEGHTVVEAADGFEALQMIRGCDPDLIICDHYMPNMDGLTLIKILRNTPALSKIPVIILTTDTKDPDPKMLDDLHICRWLVKPFVPEQLLQAIRAETCSS